MRQNIRNPIGIAIRKFVNGRGGNHNEPMGLYRSLNYCVHIKVLVSVTAQLRMPLEDIMDFGVNVHVEDRFDRIQKMMLHKRVTELEHENDLLKQNRPR